MPSYKWLDLTNPFIADFPLFNAIAVSSTNTYKTTPVQVIDFQTFTFQFEWSTGFSGTIQVLGSLDGINFRDFGVTLSAQPSDSESGVIVPLYGHGMKWLQAVYTNASGSGTLTTTGLGKTR